MPKKRYMTVTNVTIQVPKTLYASNEDQARQLARCSAFNTVEKLGYTALYTSGDVELTVDEPTGKYVKE